MEKKELWITNISKKNVTLRDLNIVIPTMKSINLLRARNGYSIEQITKSIESGSIFAKRDKIKVRKVPPISTKTVLEVSKEPLHSSTKPPLSRFVLDQPNYEELSVSDEKFFDELTNEDS